MSKEKPEVGDVFLDEHYKVKLYVLGKSGVPNTYEALETDGVVVSNVICVPFSDEQYKYLGKSKVSIKELFDVESAE